jgi:hypothetical protein
MPKPLRESPPTSSVAHFFDMAAAARAVAAPAPRSEVADPTIEPPRGIGLDELPAAQALASTGERANVKRQFVLTPSTDATFSRLVDLYERATSARLTSSHVARAVMKGIAHCMSALEREARHIGALKLPPNARGKELERDRFEARIADAFVAGVRASSAYDYEVDSTVDRRRTM